MRLMVWGSVACLMWVFDVVRIMLDACGHRLATRRQHLSVTNPRHHHHQPPSTTTHPKGVEAEAELLAAITTFFARVGLGPGDVGIKVGGWGGAGGCLTVVWWEAVS